MDHYSRKAIASDYESFRQGKPMTALYTWQIWLGWLNARLRDVSFV